MHIVRKLYGLALLVSVAWAGAVHAADRAVPARIAVADLAAACSPETVRAVAARLPFGMVIKPIANGPN
ncbi:hypothetical protein, partial [Salmonella enterica]|uniref:hypothetical protein n=1 Tax=Salmonella enterica TaxID=28901 RepID=UPI00352322B6